MTMTVSTLAPVGAPRNCLPSGYFTWRGRGIGYSFQLAITAPLYSIISYSIASAQDWKDEWLYPTGAVSAKVSSNTDTLVTTTTGKRGICNNMWNALRLPEGHKHWVDTFLLKRKLLETMSSRECKVSRKCIIYYGTTLRWRHGTQMTNLAPQCLVSVPSNRSPQISCPSLGCKKNSGSSPESACTSCRSELSFKALSLDRLELQETQANGNNKCVQTYFSFPLALTSQAKGCKGNHTWVSTPPSQRWTSLHIVELHSTTISYFTTTPFSLAIFQIKIMGTTRIWSNQPYLHASRRW